MADKIKSIAKINAYENKELRIIFFPVLILSSSPKLNFFIKTPVPTATAAAGVASLINQSSIFEKAESSLDINFGSDANDEVGKIKNSKKYKISKNIKIIFIRPPLFKIGYHFQFFWF